MQFIYVGVIRKWLKLRRSFRVNPVNKRRRLQQGISIRIRTENINKLVFFMYEY
jgi:hypothetical protein